MATFSDANRTLTITLPPLPTYDIVTKEAVVVTIPATAVKTQLRPHNHLYVEVAHPGSKPKPARSVRGLPLG